MEGSTFMVDDGVSPLRILVLGYGLSGDVGDDRAVAGEFAGVFGEGTEGVQVDPDVDSCMGAFAGLPEEEVQVDVYE